MKNIAAEIRRRERDVTGLFIEIGDLLFEAQVRGLLAPSLRAWVEANTSLSLRTANNLITIAVARATFSIPKRALAAVGYSNMGRVATLLDEGWKKVLDHVKGMTYAECDTWAREYRRENGIPDLGGNRRSPPLVGDVGHMTFAVTREGRETVERVLDQARVNFNTESRDLALVRLCEASELLMRGY